VSPRLLGQGLPAEAAMAAFEVSPAVITAPSTAIHETDIR
jgi:hypothetical protein